MASSPKPGDRCVTVSGLPVQVVRTDGEVLVLQSLVSDNQFAVPQSCILRPFAEAAAQFQTRSTPYRRRPKGAVIVGQKLNKPLAPLIDAMLLAGGKTMRGMVRELKRKASVACQGRDLEANIRARTYWLRKAGKAVGWTRAPRLV